MLDDLQTAAAAEAVNPQTFTLFLNFQPIANAGDNSGEVWLFPGRAGQGPCEWGYRVAGDWCAKSDMRIMDPQPTHFAYPDNNHKPRL